MVEHNELLPDVPQGYGNMHHVAFRVENRDVLEEWIQREEIEELVRPIDTVRSTKAFEKEYLNE